MLQNGWVSCGSLADIVNGRLLALSEVSSFRWSSLSVHEKMAAALRLSMHAQGAAPPNPPVGCIALKGDVVLAAGWTQAWGGAHAERQALLSAGLDAFPPGCEIFVTLEPCSHVGKTPPCARLFDGGGSTVYVSTTDPFASVNGKGVERLRASGNEVRIGLMGNESRAILLPFLKDVLHKRLWIGLKWAQSVDGCLADHLSVSQWLTGPFAQRYTHALRQRYDAIAVGWQTLIKDRPSLTVRHFDSSVLARHPLRVCLDPRGEFLHLTPSERMRCISEVLSGQWVVVTADRSFLPQGQWADGDFPPLHSIDTDAVHSSDSGALCVVRVPFDAFIDGLESALRDPHVAGQSPLCRPYVQSLLVEGGPGIQNLFLSQQRFDIVHALVAPLFLGGDVYRLGASPGGRQSGFPVQLGQAQRLKLLQSACAGDDAVHEWVTPSAHSLLAACTAVDKAEQE
jgi:diaminohydroxyphosphoribosylaminopyrimidine deaminase/5-amino-6-(5-phosphoribosylamino)uracil reductase